LLAAVEVLCTEVCALLAAKALGARAVRLTLYRADGTIAEAFAAMSLACREARHIFRLIEEKLGSVDAGFGVDLIRCEVVRAEALIEREDAFAAPGGEVLKNPAELLDRLSNRLGASAITVLSPRHSHLPERAETRLAALPSLRVLEKVKAGDGRRLKADAAAPVYEPAWPYECKGPRRPPFLLPRPEPIAVIAEVPDGPPARFTWRRVERRVARAEGPERLAPEWWRHLRDETGTKPARPRDYYMIEDETGAAYWVFRHGLYGREDDEGSEDAAPPSWFLHGLFA
jgi:protein ImuB